jgi:hypothetical protein
MSRAAIAGPDLRDKEKHEYRTDTGNPTSAGHRKHR